MKYQVRIHDTMADLPASKLFDTYEEAQAMLAAVRKEISETWATPDANAAYIFTNRLL